MIGTIGMQGPEVKYKLLLLVLSNSTSVNQKLIIVIILLVIYLLSCRVKTAIKVNGEILE